MYGPSPPLRIDHIDYRHEPLRALAIVLLKELRLHLMAWHQLGEDNPSFLLAIALAEDLCNQQCPVSLVCDGSRRESRKSVCAYQTLCGCGGDLHCATVSLSE